LPDAQPFLLYCFDTESGKLLWQREVKNAPGSPPPLTNDETTTVLAAPTPVTDGRFLHVMFGTGELAGFDPEGNLIWSVEDDVPAICSPVSNGELVFLVNSGGLVVCYEVRDGQRVWDKDLGTHFLASPVLAGDRVYLLSDSGEMFVFRADRQFELVGRGEVGEPCEASPAFQHGRLFIRTKNHLFCIGR